jgi:sugar lactone lactonase YvrE
MKLLVLLFLLLEKVSLAIAGDSIPFNAFYYSTGIVCDSKGNLFVCGKNNKIIKITPEGKASDFAGHPRGNASLLNGAGTMAKFLGTNGIAIDAAYNIYVADYNCVRKITPNGIVSTLAGGPRSEAKDGRGTAAAFYTTNFIAVDPNGNVYVTDERIIKQKEKNKSGRFTIIRKIAPDGMVSTLQSNGSELRFPGTRGITCDKEGNIYLCVLGSRCIKKITPGGTITTVAGQCDKREYNPVYKTGDIKIAELVTPTDIVFNKSGELYFTDSRMNRVIKISNNKVSTVAGNSKIHDRNIGGGSYEGYKDGKAGQALFHSPEGIAFDPSGNLFIVDTGNKCIRKLSPNGDVTTFCIQYPKKYYESEEF